jgi:hypothetical protein
LENSPVAQKINNLHEQAILKIEVSKKKKKKKFGIFLKLFQEDKLEEQRLKVIQCSPEGNNRHLDIPIQILFSQPILRGSNNSVDELGWLPIIKPQVNFFKKFFFSS